MKRTPQGLYAVLACLVLFALMFVGCEDQKNSDTSSGQEAEGTPAAGAFTPADIEDPAVLEAADFARLAIQAKKSYKKTELIGLQDAQVQIVAGTNYQLILILEADEGVKIYNALVFKGLDGKLDLVSFN